MNTYTITLQLSRPEESYPNLIAYLKTCTNWARPVANNWIVRTSRSAAELRDGIKERMNAQGDAVIVMKLPENFTAWATNNVSKEVTDWLHRGGR